MNIADYHASPALSSTGLRQFLRSPWHYWSLCRDPNRPADKVRAGQLEGTVLHCAVHEPDAFAQRYAVMPEDAPRKPTAAQWNAKKPSADSVRAMEWWAEFEEICRGKTIIHPAMYERALAQAKSVRGLPDIGLLLRRGVHEESIFWTDAGSGVQMRCRPDCRVALPTGQLLIDTKTFASVSDDAVRAQVERKRYDIQDAVYSMGVEHAHGDVLSFTFVFVEDEYPYAARPFVLLPRWRTAARAEVRRVLARFAECERTQVWPQHVDVGELDMPARALSRAIAAGYLEERYGE